MISTPPCGRTRPDCAFGTGSRHCRARVRPPLSRAEALPLFARYPDISIEKHHACVVFAPRGEPRPWEFKGKFGAIVHHPKGRFLPADAEQIRAAVLADLGLADAPGWMFAQEIASGAASDRSLLEYEPAPLPISAVHPAARRLPTKVRIFREFIIEALHGQPGFAMSTSHLSRKKRRARTAQ